MRKFILLAGVAGLVALPALASAQTEQQRAQAAQAQTGTQGQGLDGQRMSQPGPGHAETVTTAQFVQMVAISDMFETQAAQLAEQRGQHAEVKRFAEHMVRGHGQTTSELRAQVSAMGAGAPSLPTALDAPHQELLVRLRNANGANFDRTYAQQQVTAHRTAVDLFENYARSGDNAELKQWATRTLPNLQEHLRSAQALQQSLG